MFTLNTFLICLWISFSREVLMPQLPGQPAINETPVTNHTHTQVTEGY